MNVIILSIHAVRKKNFPQRIIATLTAAALGLSAPVAHAAEPQWESSAPESLGINDPSCVPSGDITEPVVLLHGTSNNASV